jgi:hypothetical protein
MIVGVLGEGTGTGVRYGMEIPVVNSVEFNVICSKEVI